MHAVSTAGCTYAIRTRLKPRCIYAFSGIDDTCRVGGGGQYSPISRLIAWFNVDNSATHGSIIRFK